MDGWLVLKRDWIRSDIFRLDHVQLHVREKYEYHQQRELHWFGDGKCSEIRTIVNESQTWFVAANTSRV